MILQVSPKAHDHLDNPNLSLTEGNPYTAVGPARYLAPCLAMKPQQLAEQKGCFWFCSQIYTSNDVRWQSLLEIIICMYIDLFMKRFQRLGCLKSTFLFQDSQGSMMAWSPITWPSFIENRMEHLIINQNIRLMEEILHQLTCMKQLLNHGRNYLLYQLVQDFFPSTVQ